LSRRKIYNKENITKLDSRVSYAGWWADIAKALFMTVDHIRKKTSSFKSTASEYEEE